jgi:uncharacterized LabA/DUF88 family protein
MVMSKPVKESVDARGRRKIRGSMGIEMAVDATRLAAHVDQTILFSGNGDFRPLIKAVQRQGQQPTFRNNAARKQSANAPLKVAQVSSRDVS